MPRQECQWVWQPWPMTPLAWGCAGVKYSIWDCTHPQEGQPPHAPGQHRGCTCAEEMQKSPGERKITRIWSSLSSSPHRDPSREKRNLIDWTHQSAIIVLSNCCWPLSYTERQVSPSRSSAKVRKNNTTIIKEWRHSQPSGRLMLQLAEGNTKQNKKNKCQERKS